jgi:hypothetical protein
VSKGGSKFLFRQLQHIDLVVEGGIGRGQTMPHIIRALYPNALFIGTDLARNMFNRARQSGTISEETLEQVISANLHPNVSMDGAIIRANCFDKALMADILTKTERSYPMLVAWKALNAFLNDDLNRDEKKKEPDETLLENIVARDSPYQAQLYLTEFPLGSDLQELPSEERVFAGYFLPAYHQLKALAQKNNWEVGIAGDWLLLVR